MILLAVIALLLIGLAVALVTSAVLEPRIRRSENLSQIEAYGYTGHAEIERSRGRRERATLDDLANWMGDLVSGRHLQHPRGRGPAGADLRGVLPNQRAEVHRLPSAACHRASGGLHLAVSHSAVPPPRPSSSSPSSASSAVGSCRSSWFTERLGTAWNRSTTTLPMLIDLLVVTLEAGVAFPQALRLASERIEGPLGDELRLTIQEQALGLSTLESLENWVLRCDTPSVRGFVRAMVQGDKLGVSIGQILRNQAIEVRARQRALVEERAQKAPIKMLFPLVFLIFPAMFVVILATGAPGDQQGAGVERD